MAALACNDRTAATVQSSDLDFGPDFQISLLKRSAFTGKESFFFITRNYTNNLILTLKISILTPPPGGGMAMARTASNQLGICPWSMHVRPIPKVDVIMEVATEKCKGER